MRIAALCLVEQHDLRVVAVSLALAILTVTAGAELWRQSRTTSGRVSQFWLLTAIFSIAAGIWAVHFLAMLAYMPGLNTGFRVGPTLGSLVLIVAATGLSFWHGVKARTAMLRGLCGAGLGVGVIAMHYLGMSGFVMPGYITWSPLIIAISVVSSIGLCSAGFLIGIQAKGWSRIFLGGAFIGVGVLLLHFIGMSAIGFRFDPSVSVPRSSISRTQLAFIVSGFMGVVLICGATSLALKSKDKRRALKRLKLLSESSFEGVAVLSGGRFYEVNTAFTTTTGFSRQELLGRMFLGETFIPEGEGFDAKGRAEGVLYDRNGIALPVEVLRRTIGAGDSDVIIAVRDLTERRQKEQSLSLLFDRNPAPVWVTDPLSGRILRVNTAACRLYGYAEDAFTQLYAHQLLPRDEFAKVLELRREGAVSYKPDRVWRHLKADGQEILVLPYVEDIMYEGKTAVLTTAFDVTEREQASQALREARDAAESSNRAKSAFLANMSHEIRTPLNGVLGMVQAIASGELAPVQRERLEVVRRSGEALLAILGDILDISKIEAGRIEIEAIAFDLADLLAGVGHAFAEQAQSKHLTFAQSVSDELAGSFRGDPTRIRQIVSNLLSNAIKFTDSGEVRLTADVTSSGRIRIAVSDTGEGIEAPQLANLFNKFVQADASTTREHGGTGLGLAISKELAQLMSGDIEASSIKGQGSRFALILPLEKIAQAHEPKEAANASDLDAQLEPLELKVLAAEDNLTNQLVLKTLLHQVGIEPVFVVNGQQAIEAWRREPWDLILMDVQMPVMDGPTAARDIRAEEAGAGRKRTPILALTANVMGDQLAGYALAGMDGHIAKPIDISLLFETLSQTLEAAEPAVRDVA